MTFVLIGGAALVGLLIFTQYFRKADVRKLARNLRWIAGGGVALLTALLLFRGQIGIASITGYVAFTILMYGRLGPWSFEGTSISDDNESTVKSRFIAMTLDHDSGEILGRVVAGAFKGANLAELDANETGMLLAEVTADPDSLALLETWLDRNRPGWREQFAGADRGGAEGAGPGAGPMSLDPDAEAYDVLGLAPGATADDVREAHRRLMKGVHPDQGGSNYLASKINAAKDRLLKKAKRQGR